MKSIIPFLSLMLLVNVAKAQSFTIPHDTVTYTVYTSASIHNDITNVSSSVISVTWKVVNHNLPADWQSGFGICDNILCYTDVLSGSSHTTDTISAGTTANFYVLPSLISATTSGTFYVQIRMTQGSYSKDSWFFINRFPTGLTKVENVGSTLALYPNPATEKLTILNGISEYNGRVIITNSLGQQVSSYYISNDNRLTIDIRGLSNGLYYVHLVNAKGETVAVQKFSRL